MCDNAGVAATRRKLRVACDFCHKSKIKCTGGTPCANCLRSDETCVYGLSNHVGRPKGSKSKNASAASRKASAPSSGTPWEGTSSRPKTSDIQILSNKTKEAFTATAGPSTTSDYTCASESSLSVDDLDFDFDMESGQDVFDNVNFNLFDDWQYSKAGSAEDGAILAQYLNQGTRQDSAMSKSGQMDILSNKHAIGFPEALLQSSNGEDYFSMAPGLPTPLVHAQAMCECLQDHASLLVRLNGLIKGDMPPPDTVLAAVQEGLGCWRAFMQCGPCKPNQDHETATLCAMTMRAALRLLHKSFLEASTLACHRYGSGITTPGGTHFSIGSYLIQGDERLDILKILFTKMSSQTCTALRCLEERTNAKPAADDERVSCTTAVDTGSHHLQHLFGDIHKTVRALSDLLDGAGMRDSASPPALANS